MNRDAPSSYILWGFIIIAILSAALLTWISVAADSNNLLRTETQFQNELAGSPVSLEGRILSGDGKPLEGAGVTLREQAAVSSVNGSFVLKNISRANGLLRIQAPGFRTEYVPVHLFVSRNVSSVTLDPVLMDPQSPDTVRFLFGGDTHFGRRYIDPLETTPRDAIPPDNASALIRVSDPGPGTREILHYFRPIFQEADFTSLNLESPVVRNVSTPHPDKKYILFTLPGSVPALSWLGVRYVSLGNNHVNDYQEQGVADTLESLTMNGIASSGAGSNATEAFRAYRTVFNGTPYSFLAMNSIDGSQHRITYIATDSKSGSANLKDMVRVNASIQRESAAGNIPIVQIHGGDEYTYEPADYIRERMNLVTDAGAALVVSHHPHMAQGVEVMNGVVVIEGLGNFAFDAERLETELGLLARVDMNGAEVRSVRLIPVYLQNSTPRPVSGRVANILLRRVGEFSRNASAPVYPYNGQGFVTLQPNTTIAEDRTIRVNVTVPDSGSLVLDLRQLAADDESLAEAKDDAAQSSAESGRDLMLFGDFEDWGVDGETGGSEHWDLSAGSAFLCVSEPFRGTASLCSVRYGDNRADSVIPFRNRIRVMGDTLNEVPNKNLTFIGYMKGEEAGPVTIVSKYFASEGEITFGEEEILSHPGGTFPWQPVVADIHMPADDPFRLRDPTTDPRALQIFIRQTPPQGAQGAAMFDELAVVSWEETVDLSRGAMFSTPHSRDFLRISGMPGEHWLTLRFRTFRPAAAV